MSERDGTEETIVRDIAATTLDLTCFRVGDPTLQVPVPPEIRFRDRVTRDLQPA